MRNKPMPPGGTEKTGGGASTGAAASAPFMLPKLREEPGHEDLIFYTPSARSLRTRSSIGGWVENSAATPPPWNGLTM